MENSASILKIINSLAWQFIVLVVIVVFIKDIKELLGRIAYIETKMIKISFKDVLFRAITDLQSVRTAITDNKPKEEQLESIDTAIEETLIPLLVIIKKASGKLWSELTNENREDTIKVSITEQSFKNIVNSLKALKAEKLLSYSSEDNTYQTIFSRKAEIDIKIANISDKLDRLISKAESY